MVASTELAVDTTALTAMLLGKPDARVLLTTKPALSPLASIAVTD
jgi:hypothetical protein